MNAMSFESALRSRLRGEVRTDALSRGLYSTDASLYQIQPVAVCFPCDEADVVAAVATAAEFGVSILPRGAGTSLGGSCVGHSLVIDCSRRLDALLEVNREQGWARVQPGIVRDNLNAQVAPLGLQFAPDPATGNRACVGGMIGNNSSGMRSLVYGKTVDHLLGVRALLSDGTILDLSELSPALYTRRAAANSREGEILAGFRAVVDSQRDEILARYPKVMRRVQGYNLDEFVGTDRWNLAKLICGSEGTLATVLEARVKLVPRPASTSLVVVHYETLRQSLTAVPPILGHGPSAVELLDRALLALARQNPTTARSCGFVQGDPGALLLIEFIADTPAEAADRARALADSLAPRLCTLVLDPREQAAVWAVRKAGLGLLLGLRGDRKPIPTIEDAAVPVEVLADYIDGVLALCRRHSTEAIFYAHASVGLLHVRPVLNVRDPADIARLKAIAEGAFQLVTRYGGSWSGEHGDGLSRSAWLERFFGPQLYQAFRDVKELFDPAGLMNPGKIVAGQALDDNLRFFSGYPRVQVASRYHFRRDGGLQRAIEMCNGVGACRATLQGSMCPSYRATRDEEHSPRGRANALRLALTGQLGPDGLANQRVGEALDQCLSCKACKLECPTNVDIARLKSEFLAQYHDRHGSTQRERAVRDLPKLARRLAGPLAPVANFLAGLTITRSLTQEILGFDARRTPPAFARETFDHWYTRRRAPQQTERPLVVLFDDTWLRFYEPRVGISAVALLESCGYRVEAARAGCCQRPAISHGFLDEARRDGEQTLRHLDRWLREGVPVVCCEPSCCSALVDDLPDLIADEALARRASEGITMIDVFLAREAEASRLPGPLTATAERILLHGHCHQKALFGTGAMKSLWSGVPGLTVEEVDCGCCGMAGSFGHETEHYDLSHRIAEDKLLPAIRSAPEGTTVVACGFSCRQQILDGTGVQARHWVETVRGSAV